MAIYTFLGKNFGIAIIIFTIIIRLATQPLTAKQLKSSQAMQDLQRDPRWKEMQTKYKDQKEKLAQEQQKLYKEMGISPFASCLPLLIQLPIIWALYTTLRIAMASTPLDLLKLSNFVWSTIDIQGIIAVIVCILLVVGYFVLRTKVKMWKYSWVVLLLVLYMVYPLVSLIKLPAVWSINGLDISNIIPINTRFLWMDLSKVDSVKVFGIGIPVMAIIVVITTYIQQKLMTPKNQPSLDQGAQMMGTMNIVMPLMMGWIALTVESGLAVYFLVSNLVGIAQYGFMGKLNWSALMPKKKISATDQRRPAEKVIDGNIVEKKEVQKKQTGASASKSKVETKSGKK